MVSWGEQVETWVSSQTPWSGVDVYYSKVSASSIAGMCENAIMSSVFQLSVLMMGWLWKISSRKFYSVANSTRSASDVRELFARIYNYNKKEKANNQQKILSYLKKKEEWKKNTLPLTVQF